MIASTTSSSSEENQQPSSFISFIQSQKRKPLVIFDKHIFKLTKSTVNKKYWICTLTGFTAKVHTNSNDEFIKKINDHLHLAEDEKINVRMFREKVKQRAIEETTPIPHSAINKARRGVTPTFPTTQFFEIPNPYTRTLREHNFFNC